MRWLHLQLCPCQQFKHLLRNKMSPLLAFFFFLYADLRSVPARKHTAVCTTCRHCSGSKLNLIVHGINHSFGFLYNTFTSLFGQKKKKKKKKKEGYFIKHLILHVVGQIRGDSNLKKKKKKNGLYRSLWENDPIFLTSANRLLMSLCSQTLVSTQRDGHSVTCS